MAHTLDTSAVIAASTSNPVTQAYTCGAGATVLVLAIGVAGATNRAGGAPTYNGIPLVTGQYMGYPRKYITSPEASAEMFYLLAPPTGASYDISIPNTGGTSVWGVIVTFKAQAGYTTIQDSDAGSSGLSADPSLSITPAIAGDVMVAILADGNASVPTGRTHTSLATQDWGQYVAAVQYGLIAGTDEVAMGFTIASDDWGMIMVAFKEESEVSIPGAPTDAHTDSKTDVQIAMHWTDNAADETGYKMYRDDAYLETIAADSVSYTFTGLSGGVTYDLAVKATNDGGDSAEAQLTETTNAEIGGTVYESNVTTNAHGLTAYVGISTEQTFTPQISHAIYKVRLALQKNGSPSGDLTVSILDESSGFLCAAPAIAMASIANDIYTFTFTTNPVLLVDVVYKIKIACTGGDSSNFIGIHVYYSAAVDIYPRGAANTDPYTDWYFVECGSLPSTPQPLLWSARTLPSTADWQSVTYGNGLFVAVAKIGTVAASSPDGITWTERTLPSSSYWRSVTYGNGLFVAVANDTAASSPDGITWTARAIPTEPWYGWGSVTYGNGMFVAVATNSAVAASSPDGITWTERTLPLDQSWWSVTYGNGMFVAVIGGAQNDVAASSPDGITWTQRQLPYFTYWRSVAYGNGMFVAVASNYTAAAASPDGITWTLRTLPSSSVWISVAYGNGMFVAVASNNASAASSPDSIEWTVSTFPSSAAWTSVAYGGGIFVAVASGGTMAASSDGTNAGVTITHSFPWIGKFQLCRVP